MNIVLYTDNTLPLAIEAICATLNSICKVMRFHAGTEKIHINQSVISLSKSYKGLSANAIAEIQQYDYALIGTNIAYENNYFFEYKGNTVIISFHGWNLYTDLPVTNGLMYLISSILAEEIGLGFGHDENRGCINDYWWDKTGVDVGMRAAFICQDCRKNFYGDQNLLLDIKNILDFISTASRLERDVLSLGELEKRFDENNFDVFLCYNSDDKDMIRKINASFKGAGLRTWLDEEQVEPGAIWQAELEKRIKSIRNVCVFIGKNGQGPWQTQEIRAFLSEFIDRGCKVIPVILPTTIEIPELPIFLRQMAWADLRNDYDKNLLRILNVIRKNH